MPSPQKWHCGGNSLPVATRPETLIANGFKPFGFRAAS
jgi:hypothetical protein